MGRGKNNRKCHLFHLRNLRPPLDEITWVLPMQQLQVADSNLSSVIVHLEKCICRVGWPNELATQCEMIYLFSWEMCISSLSFSEKRVFALTSSHSKMNNHFVILLSIKHHKAEHITTLYCNINNHNCTPDRQFTVLTYHTDVLL